jgi:phosphoribosylformylglycinamidine synthase subunit PurQ / glutaminase
MKAGVIVFPGSNCDQDLVDALKLSGVSTVVKLWHKQSDLENCHAIFVPGGFSFGDYLRSGAIARFSPIMKEVTRFAENGGTVMGICNGFQILTEAGLLPGALLRNKNRLFTCEYVSLCVASTKSAITRNLEKNQTLAIPIAHGEGRFYASVDTLKEIEDNDQVLFRYTGNRKEYNPNGSLNDIAGITNKNRNVFGMMPHPERVTDPRLGQNDGRKLFENLIASLN